MGIHRKQGEAVSFAYDGQPAAAGVAIVIYDANDNPRPLQSFERLIIDEISYVGQAADTTNLVYVVSGTAVPSAIPTDVGQVVAAFSAAQGIGNQGEVFLGEGEALPLGYNLYGLLVGNAWSGLNTSFSGSGRIVQSTQGVHPTWQALLTPGGNVTGY